jgi:hypothetical protein
LEAEGIAYPKHVTLPILPGLLPVLF